MAREVGRGVEWAIAQNVHVSSISASLYQFSNEKREEQNGIGMFQHLYPLTPSSLYSFPPFFFLFFASVLPFFLFDFFFFFFKYKVYTPWLLPAFLSCRSISRPHFCFFFFIGPFPSSSSETSRQTQGPKKEKS